MHTPMASGGYQGDAISIEEGSRKMLRISNPQAKCEENSGWGWGEKGKRQIAMGKLYGSWLWFRMRELARKRVGASHMVLDAREKSGP